MRGTEEAVVLRSSILLDILSRFKSLVKGNGGLNRKRSPTTFRSVECF